MKRSEKMKSYGKATAMIAVFVMIAAATACIIPMQAETADGNINITNGDVQISVGQTKVSIISVNDNAFEFENTDADGIILSYATGEITEDSNFTTILQYKYADNWSWNKVSNFAQPTGYTIDVDMTDKTGEPNGKYTLIFKGITDNSAYKDLTVRVTITSHGAPQTLDYVYKVRVYDSFDNDSKIEYDAATSAVKGGKFETDKPTIKMDGTNETNDLSSFIFYASGLNPGVALMSDLSIRGSVPADLEGWLNGSEESTNMTLDIAITDVRTGYVFVKTNVGVSYTLTDPKGLNYKVSYTAPGSSTDTASWTQSSGDVEATLISNGQLTITGADNCVATVIYEKENGTVTDRVVLGDDPQYIDISGTGAIRIIISVPGVDEQTLEFTVIDDMIPINDIGVTCGPKATS